MEEHRLVVRVQTQFYKDRDGIVFKKKLRFMKRLSLGHNFLLEECGVESVERAICAIKNLHTVEDGLYDVVPVITTREYYWDGDCDDRVEFRLEQYTLWSQFPSFSKKKTGDFLS